LNPGPRSLMAVNVTTRLRRHPATTAPPHGDGLGWAHALWQLAELMRCSVEYEVKPRMRWLMCRDIEQVLDSNFLIITAW